MTTDLLPQAEAIHLYLTDAKSDKEYTAALAESKGGWVVNYTFGARGSKLRPGTKTATPLPFIEAKAEYDKLLKGQKKKGYTTDKSGEVFSDNTEMAARVTGLLPQLLNRVSQDDTASVEAMIESDAWIAQEKHNGERRMIQCSPAGSVGGNKMGLAITLSPALAKAAQVLGTRSVVVDGEDMQGTHLMVFDLLELDGEDLRQKPYVGRLAKLEALLKVNPEIADVFRVVSTAHTALDKRAMMAQVKADKGEGVVFKRKDAKYEPNRPASSGPQIKVKFVEMATVRVARVSTGKRSVEIEVRENDGTARAVGKVAIPEKVKVPAVGDLIEVEYLYAVEGGSLVQAGYEKVRNDQTWEADCGVDKLKEVASKAAKPKRPRSPR